MSHTRSFPYMTVDELCFKDARDKYRLQALERGVLAPIREWGVGGLDEAWYALRHKAVPGLTAKTKEYLTEQIRLNEAAMQEHTEAPSYETQRILSVKPNPATLSTLNDYRERLRRMRLSEMRSEGVTLFPGERIKYTRQRVANSFDRATEAVTSPFGAVGDWFASHRLHVMTIAAAAGTLYSAYHYVGQQRVYAGVAARYEASSEVGPIARPLKRIVPELAEDAVLDLIYWEGTDCDGDDDCIEIPPNHSDPQAARRTVSQMGNIVRERLAPHRVQALVRVPLEDKVSLERTRDIVADTYEGVERSLAFSFDTEKQYDAEMATITFGTNRLQEAVEVLEEHMPKAIVEEENAEYSVLWQWRWATRIFGGFLAIGLYNFARRRQRSRYYG